jgi:gluconolactonase
MTTTQSTSAAAFHAAAQGFSAVTGTAPRLELLAHAPAHEGPVYIAGENALYLTSTPDPAHRTSILRVDLATGLVGRVTSRTTAANGMAPDPDGCRLIVCDQGSLGARAAISRVDPSTGQTQVLVDALGTRPLNSPNDVAVAPDGAIWFTDPGYGWLQGFRPHPALGDNVYRYDVRRQRLTVAAECFDKPNGLAFSPDGSVLYVGDSGADRGTGVFEPDRPHHVVAFDVSPGGKLSNRGVFATIEPGAPDGLKVDDGGRVFVSAASGVQVFAPYGLRLGEIALPGAVNFCFGGPSRNQLFITTDDAVWCAHLAATSTHSVAAASPLQGA